MFQGDKQQSKARRCQSLAPFQLQPGPSIGEKALKALPTELFQLVSGWPIELFWVFWVLLSLPRGGVAIMELELLPLVPLALWS